MNGKMEERRKSESGRHMWECKRDAEIERLLDRETGETVYTLPRACALRLDGDELDLLHRSIWQAMNKARERRVNNAGAQTERVRSYEPQEQTQTFFDKVFAPMSSELSQVINMLKCIEHKLDQMLGSRLRLVNAEEFLREINTDDEESDDLSALRVRVEALEREIASWRKTGTK